MNISNKKLYKFSWIISSISSIAGFGGSTAIFLKSNLYKEYIEDKDLLLKESSRIAALNFTGFSMVCLVYAILNIGQKFKFNLSNVIIYGVALYLPCLMIYLISKYIKNKDKKYVIDSIKIMLISMLEWITTIILIVAVLMILKADFTWIIALCTFVPIFVLAIVAVINRIVKTAKLAKGYKKEKGNGYSFCNHFLFFYSLLFITMQLTICVFPHCTME